MRVTFLGQIATFNCKEFVVGFLLFDIFFISLLEIFQGLKYFHPVRILKSQK